MTAEDGKIAQMFEFQSYDFEPCTSEHFSHFDDKPDLKVTNSYVYKF